MQKSDYAALIDKEVAYLPFYVKEFNLTKNLSLATKYQYLTEIRRFFDWLRSSGIANVKANKDISLNCLRDLKREDVMLYIDYLKNTKNSHGKYNNPTTINSLRSLYTYLTVTADNNDGEPYFYRNVMKKIESLPSSQTLNYRAHEIERKIYQGDLKHEFLDFLENGYETQVNSYTGGNFRIHKKRDIAIIALLLGTGIRVSEAANSDVEDLNIRDGMLNVTRKGGQRDAVPIAEWTIGYIRPYYENRISMYKQDRKEKGLFLTRYRGKYKRITSAAIERFVEKYSTAFGRPITPHKLRHTLASELYQETKDQVLVSQQLGQKGTSATDLYTHIGQSKQKEALNKIK